MKRTVSLIFSLLLLLSFSVSVFAENESSQLSIDMNEGRELWNEYLRQLEPYKDDETVFDRTFGSMTLWNEKYAEIKKCSKDKFNEFTQYEKLLVLPWLDTSWFVSKISEPQKFSSWENMLTVISELNYEKELGNKPLGDSYYNIVEWQYDYYMETKMIFNFFEEFGTEIVEIETSNVSENVSGNVSEISRTEEVSKEIQLPSKAPTESNVELSEEVSDVSEEGIWDNVIDYIKSNVITWIILFILCGAVVGIVIYRKKKNIQFK